MNTHNFFDDLIEALRSELQEYGGLIALFDEQQTVILKGDPEGFLNLGSSVHEQVIVLGAQRSRREELVRNLNTRNGRPEATKLTELLDEMPSERRGMIKALIDEINVLVARTQSRLQQNHLLLARCVEAAQKLSGAAGIPPVISTYCREGTVHRGALESQPRMAVA